MVSYVFYQFFFLKYELTIDLYINVMSVSIVVVQEGEGDCIEQDEEETVTPRNLWKDVPRKSKVSSNCKTTR